MHTEIPHLALRLWTTIRARIGGVQVHQSTLLFWTDSWRSLGSMGTLLLVLRMFQADWNLPHTVVK